jgi:hypothetical protein
MLDKTILLKILLLLSFLATVIVIWSFATYSSQNGLQNSNSNSTVKSEIIYVQSSSKAKFSTKSSSIVASSSSNIFSSSSSVESLLVSNSSQSSSASSLPFPILENNISLVQDIELIIQKPDPAIQLIIKDVKNRNKQEVQVDQAQSSITTIEVSQN